jgi:hypothetical protein
MWRSVYQYSAQCSRQTNEISGFQNGRALSNPSKKPVDCRRGTHISFSSSNAFIVSLNEIQFVQLKPWRFRLKNVVVDFENSKRYPYRLTWSITPCFGASSKKYIQPWWKPTMKNLNFYHLLTRSTVNEFTDCWRCHRRLSISLCKYYAINR